MPLTLLKKITRNKYAKPIVQSLASQVKLGLAKFDEDFQNIHRHDNLDTLIRAVVTSWYRIAPTFECVFPEHFIESAVYSYCGDGVKDVFHDLGLHINLELASELKKWLDEQ
tara:strand:+ start:532 stop:867 length:336 start_codon:yes stop_codon:yes gene_type:complete